MKLTPLFVAAAWLGKRDLDTVTDDLYAISNATVALNEAVLNFRTLNDVAGLLNASGNTVTAVQKGTADAKALGNISATAAAGLIVPINDLIHDVQEAVKNTINRKCTFAFLGLTSSVELQLQMLYNGSAAFSDALLANIPDFFQPTALEFSTPITNALQNGVIAFAPNANTSKGGSHSNITCLANGTTVVGSSAGPAYRIGFAGLGSIVAVAVIAAAL